jgi:hypothetical protein
LLVLVDGISPRLENPYLLKKGNYEKMQPVACG